MYQRGFYRTMDKDQIFAEIKKEGFSPMYFSVPAGFEYPTHSHETRKLLVFLDGTMTVKVGDETFHCGPRDRILIPGNIHHSAIVGNNGCNFFWSEKI
ncbi:MAG: hypothetical protein UU22_C0011G0007 [Parcubacteria group bacterium GW2011_GWA2_40_8]|uniref:Cupin type-2 domain-containing protein n=1 Tax=Candidatus Terrybacteria bacterium RIFCSPLOWO2_01_FULL_40_23 TaxID=1802366 RepID=A0A1G2PX72_9BACT|nr:MAG: hypothetical protein UT82_C0005G0014 [Parcubacteria group bacterium GW2011_GWB1_40_14]KKR78836.1 MAG: hypothetical protein UU22_C0011G0007 [Parcubacteria group bacterium GW2011_GWA2_40_8]OHA52182.1 MAG: hypothetical protein A3A97_04710 [Candidatus Terrybacteria bacterium RIFCSPLOWO2_01_FULL_40_23]